MKKGWLWPVGITLVLMIHVGFGLTVAFIAASDPSFAVEPDYYEKAVHWDDRSRQQNTNRKLGWSCEAKIRMTSGLDNSGELRVKLLDAQGTPLSDASLSAEVFFNGRAKHRTSLKLMPVNKEPGVYISALAVGFDGAWTVRVSASKDSNVFTNEQRVFVIPASGG